MNNFNWEDIIIRDTEYTTWEWAQKRNRSWKNEFREIVQIWAIRVNTKTREEIDSFNVFIKPTKNPILSDFFINITKITQEKIDKKGKEFTIALQQFVTWTGNWDNRDLYSYGRDEIVLAENCWLHHLTMPFRRGRCKNIVDVFLANDVPANKYNSSSINQFFNISNNDIEHNALADVRNILHSLKALFNK